MSCKKVMMDMGEPYSKHELLSFHTISKGALGECGLRGGYVEATNIHPGTIDQIYKIASINLSPNTTGQVRVSVMGRARSLQRCASVLRLCRSRQRSACKSVQCGACILTRVLTQYQVQACCAYSADGIP